MSHCIHNKQGSFITGVLSRASVALHFMVTSAECLGVVVMNEHSAVFEESWQVIQVHPQKQLEIFWNKGNGL